ncbi:MAG: HAD-IIIA family hydrolase [Hydrogenophaga sp.]|uniref:D-glycero-alpha-D-manno-heptose-1,7-bisphosphate 7-phosphatase n=1 Tax=Hydrogenophaga sp. TaxID=1904254 RepID=UPI0016B3A012|nr:HAD family hydrolase [Hydrogenophaga sp.]NIM41125.1 HAD-IIIA family hydrolase [Hydrogenophaga sp.]NIN26441.1 HAD-IIIA family hydrolase [Hydrogenophaga sp.]NIN31316.1 HAD-IIIA family hydrolase [Hydrogenophaga sp.]NIN55371.1 HAD-IIIA family hydrolase [Hydrogenophaga sp.]NIO51706.1 HAD-IIIA family hydrolase [Hydrogenophaga sp.]
MSGAAVFVDKDGTLVTNVPYNVDPARLRFEPQALAALRDLSRAGFSIVVVSNQSGLARGLFTWPQLLRLREALERRLINEGGVVLRGFYVCPHAPDAQGQPTCDCRKPAPTLLRRAAQRLDLDLARSWMVGDTLDDVEAGRRAGCRAILYDSGGETVWRDGPERRPHARHTRWSEVARTILADARRGRPPTGQTRAATQEGPAWQRVG